MEKKLLCLTAVIFTTASFINVQQQLIILLMSNQHIIFSIIDKSENSEQWGKKYS